ncbi:MAG: inorganic phosphate transporter [Acidobacteriota bacterium]
MSSIALFAILIIIIALVFDYINGFHDAANSIATVVSTRVLSPVRAVALAAFFNFIAAFAMDVHVAKTIGNGLIKLNAVDSWVIFSGLLGAILWNLLTWYWGLPTSSSHALIGGYAGAAVAKAGLNVILIEGWTKTLVAIVLSPLIGLFLGLVLMTAIFWIFHRTPIYKVDKYFRSLQIVSASLYSLAHGTNDAQKTMGIITGVLITSGYLTSFDEMPFWVVLICHAAMGLGTLSGGWRIIKTMGSKITRLKPVGGFAAETAGAITILTASRLGIPVSTTHTITGAIVGVGSLRRLSAVRWGVAGRIVWAWLLTIPAAFSVAALCYYLTLPLH